MMSWLARWKQLNAPAQGGRPARTPHRPRMAVTRLEDRAVPATITVTSLADNLDVDGLVTLREAIQAAETDTAVDGSAAGSGADTIVFDPTLTASSDATITLTQFDTGLDADEFGPTALRISTNVTIQGPTGANGVTIARATTDPNPFRLFYVYGGAGNESAAKLTVENLTLSGGLAQGFKSSVGGASAGMGGVVFNRGGSFSAVSSTLSANTALGGSGTGGLGNNVFGGAGVGASPQAESSIPGGPNPGTLAADGGFGGGGRGRRSTESGGSNGGFGGGGGGVYGRVAFNGGFGGGAGSTVNLLSGTAAAGLPGFGGGAADMEGRPGAGAGMGGAVFNYTGAVTLRNSTLSGNTAQGGRGNATGGGGAGYGAGVFNYGGSLTVENATLAANTVTGGLSKSGSPSGEAAGEAIYSYADAGGEAFVTLRNSILGTGTGGASVLVSNKTASSFGATVTATAPNLLRNAVVSLGGGTTTDTGVTVGNAALAGLADNGGPTFTHDLPSTSPARDAGDSAVIPPGLPLDQRGGNRTTGPAVDLGAVEYYLPGPYVVDSTLDGDDGDYSAGKLTLREAVNLADAAPGVSAISFSAAVFGGSRQTITLTDGPLVVASLIGSTVLTGPATGVRIDANYTSRVFEVLGDLTASKVELVQGRSPTGENGGVVLVLGGGRLQLSDVTVAGGSARKATASPFSGGGGGGIAVDSAGGVTLTNVTLSQNSAQGSVGGGALFVQNNATAVLANVTVVDNQVNNPSGNGGGIAGRSGASISLVNTLAVGNRVITNPMMGLATPSDFLGPVVEAGSTNNIISTAQFTAGTSLTNGVNGNQIGFVQDSENFARVGGLEGYLGDYGGPVRTIALLPGSVAIDAAAVAGSPELDARGVRRRDSGKGVPFFGSGLDVGAFESRGFTATITGGDNQSAATGAAFASPLKLSIAPNQPGEPVVGAFGSAGRITFTPPDSDTVPGLNTTAAFEVTIAGVSGQPFTVGTVSQSVTANSEEGSYTVTVGGRGFFVPVGGSATKFSLTNAPPLPTVGISASPNVTEGTGSNTVAFTVTRSNTTDPLDFVPVTITGTASAADFSGVVVAGGTLTDGPAAGDPMRLTFAAGSDTITVTYAVADDFLAEADETRELTLGTGSQFILGTSAATGILLQNDFGVTNTNDSGEGSLRQAVLNANFFDGPQGVLFEPTFFATPRTITLTTGELRTMDEDDSLTIAGPAAGLTVSGNNASRVFHADNRGTLILSDLTVTEGKAEGGGIRVNGGATVTLDRVTVAGNQSLSASVHFGGLYVEGTATLRNSTVSGNSSNQYGGIGVVASGSLTLINSTVTNNKGSFGGGLYVDSEGSAGRVQVSNSVIAGNVGADGTTPNDLSGSAKLNFTFLGVNLGSVLEAGSGDNTVGTPTAPADPRLGPLAANGGPTRTHKPLAGSPLVGAGSNALVPTGVTLDQTRGPRVVGTVDIGAVEIQDSTPAAVTRFQLAASAAQATDKALVVAAGATGKVGFAVRSVLFAFDEPVSVTAGTLLGLPTGVTVAAVEGSGTAAVRFVLSGTGLASGTHTLTLAETGTDAVRDLAGNPGLTGGFTRTVSVRVGDLNGDGRVTSADLAAVSALIRAGTYDPLADLDGDGDVDQADLAVVRSRIGQ